MLTLIFQSDTGAIAGVAAIQFDDISLSAASTVEIKASSSVTLDNTAIASTATVALTGQAAVSLADTSLSTSAALAIQATQSTVLADAAIVSTAQLPLVASAAIALDAVSLSASSLVVNNAYAAIVLDDIGLVFDSTIRLPNYDADGPRKRKDRRRSARQESERRLNLALQKALEPKGRRKVDKTPWLAEPILLPPALDVPDYNPVLAGLYDEMTRLQRELAAIKFNREQEEADIELLLMAL